MANNNFLETINQRQTAMGQIILGETKPIEEIQEAVIISDQTKESPVISVEGAQYSPGDWEKIVDLVAFWDERIYRRGLKDINGQPNPDYDPAYAGALPKVSLVVEAKRTQGQDLVSRTFSNSGQETSGVEVETVKTATLSGVNPRVESTDHSIVQVISTAGISSERLLTEPGQFANSEDLVKAGDLARRIDSGQVVIQGIYMKKPPKLEKTNPTSPSDPQAAGAELQNITPLVTAGEVKQPTVGNYSFIASGPVKISYDPDALTPDLKDRNN